MSHPELAGVKACVFDAYGTLFDIVSAVNQHKSRVGEHADKVSKIWRRKQLEYTWLRSLMGRYVSFSTITEDALDYALDMFGIADPALRADLLKAYDQPEVQPDVKAALDALHANGKQTAIVSNASPDVLENTLAHAGLDEKFDMVLSVAEVREYKPSRRVYQLAQSWLQLDSEQVVYCSTNPWDIAGASAFGFKTVWVNRFGLRPERLHTECTAEIKSLEELPGLLG